MEGEMPEEKDAMVAENDGKVSMEGAEEDSETSEESSTEKTEGQETSEKDEKVASESVSDEEELDDKVEEGKPIPYERFKKVIEKKNKFKTDYERLSAENEELSGLLNNPTVFRALLQSKGVTDPKILNEKMKEGGFEVKEEIPKNELFKQLSQGEDLKTQEGWFSVMEKMFKHFSKEALQPIEQKLSQKEREAFVQTQESDAKKLAKEVYGIEYGVSGKDEDNPNTAVGKIAKYLDKNPKDAYLGHVKLLKLALAEEGTKLGEQKGVKKEKDRQKSLRNSAMEDDAQVVKEGTPSSDWSVSEIMAYRRKYGK